MFEIRNLGSINQNMIDCWDWVLPNLHPLRDLRPQIKNMRSEIAVRELEPSFGKGLSKGLLILMKAASDRRHDRIVPKRQISGGHDWSRQTTRNMRIRDHVLRFHIFGHPLPSPSWAFGELPLISEHHLEIALIPAGGIGLPCPFNSTGDGVFSLTALKIVRPAQTLLG